MKKSLLLAVALLAGGAPALAESRLPADWEQKVAAAVPDAGRARQVVSLGRAFDAKREVSIETTRQAEARRRATFLDRSASPGDRQLSLNLFRDRRRKAANEAIEAFLAVRNLVSKKEWEAMWPSGYFAPAPEAPRLADELEKGLPGVVSDPARLRKAQDAAAALKKAVRTDAALGQKAKARLEDFFEDWDVPGDDFVELVNRLDEQQERNDRAVLEASARLQQVLTPEEWDALSRSLAPGR